MKRQKLIHLNSREIFYNVQNLPVSFASGGTVTWSLTTPKGTYSFSGDARDSNLNFGFPSFEGIASFSVSYENMMFEEPVGKVNLTLSSGEKSVSGESSVSIDNLSLEEVLSLNIDVVGEEVHPMILECTTTADNETIKLPLSGNTTTPLNARVDWGDGSPVETVTSDYPTHEYANSGVYEVKVSGTVPRISSYEKAMFYLTGIKSWGKLDGLTSMKYGFYSCIKLTNISGDEYGCFENVTDFSHCFYNCTGLTCSIPENLFSNCSNVTDFSGCFNDSYGLTGSIPENLFANCPNVTDFNHCFDVCAGLTGSIPENLFANCPNVTDFNHCFSGCRGLTGSIPEGLFANCPNVNDFGYCFSGCRGLTGSIPENLFANCPNVTSFESCFDYCSGLTSIPENLFANCPNVTSFESCFCSCRGLTGSIPENLFANCPNVTTFLICFKECRGLTSIPEGLFANCPNVTNFSGCFSNCRGLTGNIPENLFANCPNVTDFYDCFDSCSGLTGNTPVDILEDGTKIELWERAGKPGYPNSITGNYCFYNCTNLSNYSEIPDNWK